jgi:hypothetical protein
MRQQKTLEQQMFPQWFPQDKNGGGTNRGDKCVIAPVWTEPMTTEEKSQPLLDDIWEWFGSPDTE